MTADDFGPVVVLVEWERLGVHREESSVVDVASTDFVWRCSSCAALYPSAPAAE